MKNAVSIALCVFLLLVSRTGATQPNDGDARSAAYREGYAALQAKQWDEAYAIFERLWREAQTYDVALHLGHAEYNIGKKRQAAEHLAFGIAHLPPGEAKELGERSRVALGRIKQELGSIIIVVDRSGADVRVDTEPRGKTPVDGEVFVDPGHHAVEATLAGYTNAKEEFDIGAGEQRTVVFKLDPLPAATPVAPNQGTLAADGGTGSSSKARAVVLVSGAALTVIAGASTIVFAVKGGNAADRADTYRSEVGPSGCSTPTQAASLPCSNLKNAEDDRVAAHRGANISLAITAVAAVGTAVAFIAWPRPHRSEGSRAISAPSVGFGLGSVALSGEF